MFIVLSASGACRVFVDFRPAGGCGRVAFHKLTLRRVALQYVYWSHS